MTNLKLMTNLKWYRGSLHAHTNRSDGDSDPEAVARWYGRNGYDFLVLTDHNCLTTQEGGKRRRWPLLVPGEEVSARINDEETAIHVNGIGIRETVEAVKGTDPVSTLQANVDAIRAVGGIASINHPNYTWAFDHHHISQVAGATLLEVYNGHPAVNSHGAGGKPSCEEIWDSVLSAGRRIFGVATDDSHHLKGDFLPRRGNPGRGWVMVRAPRLAPDDILDALKAGDFYASTGVTLSRLEIGDRRVALQVEQERDYLYTIEFIGRQGELLAQTYGTEAEYRVRGDEGYVRARVIGSDGTRAWMQPLFLE